MTEKPEPVLIRLTPDPLPTGEVVVLPHSVYQSLFLGVVEDFPDTKPGDIDD